MRLLRPTAAAALACLLAACNTMAPRYERPAAPVAAAFPTAAASAAAPSTGVAPAAQPWQSYFQDPRLAQLIQSLFDYLSATHLAPALRSTL